MFKIWYDWDYKRNIIKPILTMSGTYEITINGYIVNELLDNEEKVLPETILMQQALEYIEYAKQFGAELLPIKIGKRYIQKEIIQFYLKFENNRQRNNFEKFIKKL